MTSDNEYTVWFDLETTGVDPKSDRIIQIGMIKTVREPNGHMRIVDAREQKINPEGVKSRPEAFEKHRITDEELLMYPPFRDVADAILEFMEGCDIGGHNCVKFDIPLLMEEMSRCGREFSVEKRRIVDTRLMDMHYNPRTLESAYRQYCGDAEPGCNAHDAICDTEMCIKLYNAMIDAHTPSTEELDNINGNDVRIDMSGFFVFNENMHVCMGRGKYAGMRVEDVDPSYFTWMCGQDFPPETVGLAKRCYEYLSRR